MTIRHVVLDFDGTCTEVHATEKRYLDEYYAIFKTELYADPDRLWKKALKDLKGLSPDVGWMLDGAAPSAPVGADPYILAGEAAKRVLAQAGIAKAVPSTIHERAYDVGQSPWRSEAREVLEALVARGVSVTFISNSRTTKIEHRLDDLLGTGKTRKKIAVHGGAAKFSIRELGPPGDASPKISPANRAAFDALLPGERVTGLGRPVYLRRGKYFEALCGVWGNDPEAITSTLVCGDVWELDLAMPAALGCAVHLITRARPFATCPYERAAVKRLGERGRVTDDLRGVLKRL
jgi:phosphoglycolate phosphatase-like HAD superfamily hydrolase